MRIVADTSAWIEFLRGTGSTTDELMATAIDTQTILVPDLVYHEVLRGMPTEAEARKMIRHFESFIWIDVGGMANAGKAAEFYRFLRSKGTTVRGTVDSLIATWCIDHTVPLLHADRDFEAYENHLGLRRWTLN